jgi:transposase
MAGYHGPYPEEFRREAVQLARSSGKSVPQVARDLGVSGQALRDWLRQDDIDEGRREGVTSAEREQLQQENARLRRENKILREEREILKKAAAFFANETNGTR